MGNIKSHSIADKTFFTCIFASIIILIDPLFAFAVFVWTGESTSVIDI